MEYLNIIFNIDVKEKKETKDFFRDHLPAKIKESFIEIPNPYQFETVINSLRDNINCFIWLHPSKGADVLFEGISPSYVTECKEYLNRLGIDYREVTRSLQATIGSDIVHINQMPNVLSDIKSYQSFELKEIIASKINSVISNSEIQADPDIMILFIGASPKELGEIKFKEEFKKIESIIKDSPHFGISPVFHASITNIQDNYKDIKPFIIHFACHSDESGIYLEDDSGYHKKEYLNFDQLKGFFSRRRAVDCVIFNSCRSKNIGIVLTNYIPTVIYINEDISNTSSNIYSEGFYSNLVKFSRKEEIDFRKCHEHGRERLSLKGKSEEYTVEIIQEPKLD